MIEPYNPLVSRLYLDNGRLKEEIKTLKKDNERLREEVARLRSMLDDHVSTVRDDDEPPSAKEWFDNWKAQNGYDPDGPPKGGRMT